jgi:hypothetical protein
MTCARAAVIVYTDRTAWALDAARLATFITDVDFESESPRPLVTGDNFVTGPTGFMDIVITGDPGLNRIESNAGDPLSPNGSTFYAGEVDGTSPDAGFPSLELLPYAIPGLTTIGFGADWVGTTSQDGLTMDVAGATIAFSDYLPTGSGFLGILSDSVNINPVVLGTEIAGGAQLFGMDNVTYVFTPVPTALWLFSSGLLFLLGIARRRQSAEL